jgi:hypothetical protein
MLATTRVRQHSKKKKKKQQQKKQQKNKEIWSGKGFYTHELLKISLRLKLESR